MNTSRQFSSSLRYLPDFSTKDVVRLVDQFSITDRTKLDKGYKFFFENYLYDYEGNVKAPLPNTNLALVQSVTLEIC